MTEAGASTITAFEHRWAGWTLRGTLLRRAGGVGTVIFLHGAGAADHRRSEQLMADVADRLVVDAVAFDFTSHGESEGNLADLSLERRFLQAASVIDQFAPDGELLLAGFSMSGQTIADLLSLYGARVTTVALFAPAFYPVDAWTEPFGPGFTRLIRRHEAWRTSTAFASIAEHPASVLLCTAGNDPVIPPALLDELRGVLAERDAASVDLVLPDAPHTIGTWLATNQLDRRLVVDSLAALRLR